MKFVNEGNDCYLNSVFQVFINNDKFSQKIINSTGVNNLVYENLKKLLTVNYANVYQGKIINPIKLKNCILKEFPKYSDKTVEYDAHELFHDLISLIHTETGTQIENVVDTHTQQHLSAHYKNATETFNSFFENKQSIVSDTFYGQYIKRYSCSGGCLNKFFNYDPFNGFTIFPREDSSSVKQLINDVFLQDFVPYECKKCTPEGFIDKEHTIDQFIYKLPETLIVTVNRFNTNGSKNVNSVIIDETIDLSNYYLSNEPTKYTFSSVICHLGSTINHGHYVTITKKNGIYYIFDDEKIKEMAKGDSISQLNGVIPYIIFYEKV